GRSAPRVIVAALAVPAAVAATSRPVMERYRAVIVVLLRARGSSAQPGRNAPAVAAFWRGSADRPGRSARPTRARSRPADRRAGARDTASPTSATAGRQLHRAGRR